MGQAPIPVGQKTKNVIRNPVSLKMESYPKGVNLRRRNDVFRSSKL